MSKIEEGSQFTYIIKSKLTGRETKKTFLKPKKIDTIFKWKLQNWVIIRFKKRVDVFITER